MPTGNNDHATPTLHTTYTIHPIRMTLISSFGYRDHPIINAQPYYIDFPLSKKDEYYVY